MPGSGKGTCVDYLVSTYDWPSVYFGGMVYEEVERRGLDIVKDEAFVRLDMRQREGMEVLAKRAADKVVDYKRQGQKVVVLDGLYSWSEYKHLEQSFGADFIVIAVVAPKSLRHERVISRKDVRRAYTLEQIKKRDVEEIENLEKGGPIANADYVLHNDSTPEELLANLDRLLKELKLS